MSHPHVHPHNHHGHAPEPYVEDLGGGVFAYIRLDGSWGLNNSAFLVGRKGITAIDNACTEGRGRDQYDAMRRVSELPVQVMVNTHDHGDHCWTNYLWPEATIIGHELCRQGIINTDPSGFMQLFPELNYGHVEMTPPFVTFEDRINVYVDDLKLELIYVGPAHTNNDIVIWAPERRILFAGDLLANGCTPFIAQGSIEGQLRALQRVRELGAQTILPGHGKVCGPEAIDDAEDYTRFVQETARKGFDAGLTPLELAKETDLGRFGEWLEAYRLAGNLHRAYAELRGEAAGQPLPLGPIFRDMVDWNGGQRITCLA